MKWFKRILIFIAVIIALCIGAVWVLSCWLEYHEKHYFQDSDRIEQMTGVRLPKLKVIDYREGSRGFTGDFEDSFTFEFKTMPTDEMFNKIDSLIQDGHKGWSKEGNKYSYSKVWGNGMEAPKGESDNEDRFFDITITRGSKQGSVRHGMW